MAAVSDALVSVEGIQLSVLDRGAGTPLLWLHGSSGRDPVESFLDALAGTYRVIAPEHPGFGTTERISWIKDMEDLSLFYRHFVQTYVGSDEIALAGHSLGGWMAAEFAYRNPQLLRCLVLVSPLGLRQQGAPIADLFMLDPGEIHRRGYADPSTAPPQPEMTDVDWIKNQAMTAQLGWAPRLFNPRLAERLRWITSPALVLQGDADGILSPTYSELFASLIPDAERRLVPGVSHHPHREDPARTAEEITRFLDKHTST